MLRYADAPQEGSCWNLSNSPFWPPEHWTLDADAYRDWLRRLYLSEPRVFLDFVRQVRERDVTLITGVRPDLLPVLYEAVVAVAASRGWSIAGGRIASAPPSNVTGRYRPRGTASGGNNPAQQRRPRRSGALALGFDPRALVL